MSSNPRQEGFPEVEQPNDCRIQIPDWIKEDRRRCEYRNTHQRYGQFQCPCQRRNCIIFAGIFIRFDHLRDYC